MEKITREQVESAINAYKAAKIERAEIDGRIKDAEDIISAYGSENITEFADGRLPMKNGIIALKAGAAKPMKANKPLSTAARSELASVLPPQYVKMSCDFMVLFDCQDKTVRQILKQRGVSIVREDKFTII